MRFYNRLTDKSKFLAKSIVFLYATFAFFEWNFSPGDWSIFTRTGFLLLFAYIAETNDFQ